MQSARRFAPVAAVSALATLAPLIAVAAPAAPVVSSVSSVSAVSSVQTQRPTWQRCSPDQPAAYQCTTLKVPLDYRAPGGKKIDVAVSRIKAADPRQRRGVLLFNPGGPGGSGLGDPLDWGGRLPQSVLDRYDLIGFDPRGVGKSTPVECGTAPDERMVLRPYRSKTFASDVAWAKRIAEKCRAKYGADLKHFTTRNTARDMDAIRAALGEQKINYIGVSYGTYLGAVYTQLFPRRSDRIILDSAVDPKLVWRGMLQSWAKDSGFAFWRFLEWAAKNNDQYGFGTSPQKIAEDFFRLVRQADRKPVKVGEKFYDGAAIREFMRPMFYRRTMGADMLGLVRDAAAGKPVPDFPAWVPGDNDVSMFNTVACGDTDAWPRDPQRYAGEAAMDSVWFPLYGDHASNITPCAFWDRPAEPVTKVDNRVPSLILQAEWDSQTPLSTAQGMHRALKGSRMVTVDEGETHGVYRYGISSCADTVGTDYLVTGKLPAKDVTCAANPPAAASAKESAENAKGTERGAPVNPNRF
ncbi:alpha/beta hydrolase [Streptomyces qinzhouensis]|uniref:Alpha/beta hydrolase n=1 Tax=Streptomyces qinzhouensis TaxID=2599401 RepID=A0A5B8JJ18_9ACTN|nr:alpha/beta hydrolase [Streptomyces qinzhouensis]QDY77483.1 alpha/beta hydrolase [Streptomyces qinzhouensis]